MLEVWLARHGETDWSATGKHTGRTDVPLTDRGRDQARALKRVLSDKQFEAVWTSPLTRARDTAALAGYPNAVIVPELVEWDYGEYEGRRTKDIRVTQPNWTIWKAAIEKGETLGEAGERADKIILRLLQEEHGPVLCFGHGHFLRILAARWAGLEPTCGRRLLLDTGTISILGFEHDYRALRCWNAPLSS